MLLTRRTSWFLVAAGVWNWVIWPRFLRAVWVDDRAWDHGATSFLLVHVVLVAASLAIGTAVAVVGVRGLRAARARRPADASPPLGTPVA